MAEHLTVLVGPAARFPWVSHRFHQTTGMVLERQAENPKGERTLGKLCLTSVISLSFHKCATAQSNLFLKYMVHMKSTFILLIFLAWYCDFFRENEMERKIICVVSIFFPSLLSLANGLVVV